MRILAKLRARSDVAYDHTYHHKLRGRIWTALEETEFADRHDTNDPPGFVYSNPFPPRDMVAGEERHLIVAAPEEQLLTHVARDFQAETELNIGDMPFEILNVSGLSPDVGEPGTTGTLETGTGVLVRIPPWKREVYGIEGDYGDQATYWRPEHTMEPFREQITTNLDVKHGLFGPEWLPGPAESEDDLFEGYDLIKTFSLPVTPKQGQELIYVLSKWRFKYRVRDDDHRRHLNLALDCGLGERNSLGFGLLNLTKKTTPIGTGG